ncbi:MAG: DUF1667 domain-containing protein [Tissierellia bacterium]|nr:DUF1667 domain-containing protein [Tissierellia bacterium]
MKRELNCIGCPMGCNLTVEEIHGEFHVTGQECARGDKYAQDELTHPIRSLSSVIPCEGGIHPMLPVRTSCPIPKEQLFAVMRALRKVKAVAPIGEGEVLVQNIANTGADLIATRDMERIK